VQASRRLYHILFQEAGGHEEHAMSPLRHLVLGFLAEAMEQGALTPTDPDLLARFLLDALHAILVPLAHQDGLDRQHTLASLSELLRQVLAPAHATASQAPPRPA
jgi:hypothetical protein